MRSLLATSGIMMATFLGLLLLHFPLLHLPYFWDEAGYYIPAALDFYHKGLLIPESTLPTGHTPLVMVYLGLAWHLFGFSPLVTRAAMVFVAAGTVIAIYALGRRVTGGEPAAWSAALLALSPLFFAQSSLVYLDLPAALFTVLAILALLESRMALFALAASLTVLSKETAVILLPVVWVFAWRSASAQRSPSLSKWLALTAPLLPLLAWTLYYHHATGYWTGNREYLEFNLYSTLRPVRIFWTLLRRLYEISVGGFNWLLVVGAALGMGWEHFRQARHRGAETQRSTKHRPEESEGHAEGTGTRFEWKVRLSRDFVLLTAGLTAAYTLMLSVVGGAILPRYLLPIFPLFYLAVLVLIWRLPRAAARRISGAAAVCFVAAWFLNPPYPFPFEDNLSYADFIRLHQRAARFLEPQPGEPRILTAWPASDELTRPFLGYVHKPLQVVPIAGFTPEDFRGITPGSFDLLYLYSRKWEPPTNLLTHVPVFQNAQRRYFGYMPQIRDEALAARYGLRLLARFERRGQWVRIYSTYP